MAAGPALCAAVAYDMLKSRDLLQASDLASFGLGFVVAFLSAALTVRGFIRLLGSYTLRGFGWYRIFVAMGIFALLGV